MHNKLSDMAKRKRVERGYVTNGITFHDLRHSFASLLPETGVHMRTMKDLMTHSDIKMTERYTHIRDNTRKRAVNGLGWNLHEK